VQKTHKKPHFGYIDALDMRFYSIILKFEPHMHKKFYYLIQITNVKKNQKKKSYSFLFLDEIMPKNLQKTHFGYIDVLDLRFYSITLKFEPQVHKELY
jgi:hypothetical protein